MKLLKMIFRDLLAIPFFWIALFFLWLTIVVGGNETARDMRDALLKAKINHLKQDK